MDDNVGMSNQQNGGCGTLIGFVFLLGMCMSMIDSCKGGGSGSSYSSSSEIDDIISAKAYVRSQLNYPDTADFHDLSTVVTPTHVKLTVTAKNAFGVPSTHTFNVPRN
jgi:hypothetical protein